MKRFLALLLIGLTGLAHSAVVNPTRALMETDDATGIGFRRVTVVSPDGLTYTAGTATTILRTDTVADGADEVTPKYAVVNATSSGLNVIVAGVAGKKIRVLNWYIVSSGGVTAIWQSNVTAVSGPMPLVASSGAHAGEAVLGHFETIAGEPLVLNLSGATLVGGSITYIEVD